MPAHNYMHTFSVVVFLFAFLQRGCNMSVKLSSESSEYLNSGLPIDKIKKTLSPMELSLVERLPSITLLKYTSYKDVSILHFRIPHDTRRVMFTFKAFEETKNLFHRKCMPQNITLHLKAGSYPVISPENITFPKNFLNADQRLKTYNLNFKSDKTQHNISIPGPQIGNWFAAAFLSWTDPKNDHIEQQGLSASCDTLLEAEMSVSRVYPLIINNGQEHSGNLTYESENQQKPPQSYLTKNDNDSPAINKNTKDNAHANSLAKNENSYKFFVPADIAVGSAHFTFVKICMNCPSIGFYVQPNAYPSLSEINKSEIQHTVIKPSNMDKISTEFYVQPNTWHYALIKLINVLEANSNTSEVEKPDRKECQNMTDYFTDNKCDGNHIEYSFQIDFKMPTNTSRENKKSFEKLSSNRSLETKDNMGFRTELFRGIEFYPLLRQTYREFFMFDFDLTPDVNGTVPAILNLTSGKLVGFKFELREVYDIGGTLSFLLSMKNKTVGKNQTIIICMNLGEPGTPTWPDKCRYKKRLIPASSIVNITSVDTNTGLVHVPFPESGQWYITMGLFCHDAKAAQAKVAMEQQFEMDKCNSSVMFTISSNPCVVGGCGRFGQCYHYMSGGFVFSTCICLRGYRGWDCSDDSQVPSSMSILLASLLLTLSNIFFIPSIYIAIHRKYYTESVIYFFVMVFSIFYHACDTGEGEQSFCLFKIGVLQFCDFYCGLLAIWVTLIAMTHLNQNVTALLHMLGAILLALGTELNKQSLWIFLAPALTGICLILASWGLRYFKHQKWVPSRRYMTMYVPLGLVLVISGLVCYAFLQTKNNYHIVHSIWHMAMALSILCLLPSCK